MGLEKDIRRVEASFCGLMISDERWCRQRIVQLRQRLGRNQPVDLLLGKLIERVRVSSKRVDDRQASLPVPVYDDALPITAHGPAIIEAIKNNPVVIVAGETGSGKTTQLPKFCLEAGRGIRGLVGCTQPRRIAARAMASRVAEELQTPLGQLVGYQVRFRDQTSPGTLLKFMTDGILLAEATGDRMLEAYDTLIIDEAHERSLNIDFLLGYLKRLSAERPELRIIITSATIDTAKFSAHFDEAPIIEVSGRGYPVDLIYQPLPDPDAGTGSRDLYRGILDAVHRLDRIDPRGDVLVFLSGEREIHEARDHLTKAHLRHTEVLPLYARLSSSEQQRVFHPGPARRVILATNVAETSLTVPRIRFVIDSGFARISRYAHRSRIQRLPIEAVSQASANQRSGRCGRLGPGTCVRLYSEEDFEARSEFTEPEILRTSLASVILRMQSMGLGRVEQFPFIDPPAPRMINDAYQLLLELEAMDSHRQVTALGKKLARWPVDVRLGRIILEGDRLGCPEDAMVLAAGLSIQDPRERPLEAQEAADECHKRFISDESDFEGILALWAYLREQRKLLSGNQFRKRCRREFLSWQRVLEWFDLVQQLRDLAREERLSLKGGHGEFEVLHKAILAGMLSNVGQRHPEERHYVGARNRSFHVFPGSGLFGKTPAWLMSAEIVETTKPYARINARIKPEWVEEQGRHLLKRTHFDPHWSRRSGRVMAWEQVSLFGLVLVEKRRVAYAEIDPPAARRIFLLEALVRGQINSRASFLDANRRARDELERLEHKRRQRDVLVDEEDLLAFFDSRVPKHVLSAKALSSWFEQLDSEERTRLHLGEDVLLRTDAGQVDVAQYPDNWVASGHQFSLNYLFDPGHADDGVTLTAPLTLLNTLDAADLSWQVPALRREKVLSLMKFLPKPVRRALTPLPQFAEAVMEQLDDSSGNTLQEAVADALKDCAGVEVQARDFDGAELPIHLEIKVQVVDDDGSVLAEGRDLAALKEQFGEQAQRRFMDQQGAAFNRDGITRWDFEDLPAEADTPSGTRAFPALVDLGECVGLRLFESWDEAALSHQEGVLRLLSIALAEKMRWMRRQHGLPATGLLAWSTVGESNELIEDLAWFVLRGVVGVEAQSVRSAAAWADLESRTRQSLGNHFQKTAGLLSEVLAQWAMIQSRLAQPWPAGIEASLADVRSQWEDMMYPGFLGEVDAVRFEQFPRYLKGIQSRLERLAADPGRDQRMMALVQPFWNRYLERLASGSDYDAALDEYRWLLAEYRVSVFAQQLGTRGKVSSKRLEESWRAVLDA